MIKIGIVIQCRDNASRYTHKSVRPFYEDKSILQIIIERFKHLPYIIIVVTTEDSLETKKICKELDVPCYHGHGDDVILKFLDAAYAHKLTGFFRVCADNPFVSLPLMYPLTTWGFHNDYIAYKDCMLRHEGLWMEYVKTSALYKAMLATNLPYDIQNVTPFIYKNPWLFHVKILQIPQEIQDLKFRLTVDTESDFKIAQRVYKEVREQHWYNILDYLKKHPKLLKKMKKNIEENPK